MNENELLIFIEKWFEPINERIDSLKKKYETLESMQETIVDTDPVKMEMQIANLQSKVKLYEATIVGGDFQWLEIDKIKKTLRIIADWTLLGKAPKGLDEFMIHKKILEIFEEKTKEKFKLVKTVRVTPNRGYRTVWEMSFRIPHKILISLLGEPSTEEEGTLYTKTLEGEERIDKTIDDLTIGHWYVDVNGEPFRIDLIDIEKLFQSKVKNFANPKREEVVYIYGNGFTATMSFLEIIYSRFGELKVGKW